MQIAGMHPHRERVGLLFGVRSGWKPTIANDVVAAGVCLHQLGRDHLLKHRVNQSEVVGVRVGWI